MPSPKKTTTKAKENQKDFLWSDYEEPHAIRKRQLLQKHGKQIQPLMGHEPLTKYLVTAVVLTQLTLSVLVPRIESWWLYFLVAWGIGGTITHCLFLAVHEVTHHLAFEKVIHNDLFAIFTNIPIVVPYSMMFKTYHAEHHRYQGWDGIDTDIAGDLEAKVFTMSENPKIRMLCKAFFLGFQVFFYALRPCIVRPITNLTRWHVFNYAAMISVHYVWYSIFGSSPIIYLLLCDFLGCSFHPMAGHFLSEHYIFSDEDQYKVTDAEGMKVNNRWQETYSYYGPLNFFGWNVGYHNEHHDFPNVAWSRLPLLKEVGKSFYEPLAVTKSWPMAIVDFIMQPQMSSYRRVKREKGAGSRKGGLLPTTTKTLI